MTRTATLIGGGWPVRLKEVFAQGIEAATVWAILKLKKRAPLGR